MTSKLSIYNGALSVLGERKINALTDNVESRRKLDDVWDNDFLDRILQMGQWNFATRTVELTFSPSTSPSFGYEYAFDKPQDFVRTTGVFEDEFMVQPLLHYSDEASWIFTDLDTIYLAYVSNDTQWGGDFSLWPPNFTEMAEHYMAYKVAPRLIGLDPGNTTYEGKWKRWLAEAKATDAMESPVQFAPEGNWARSRRSRNSGNSDRGRRSRLIG